MRGQKVKMSTSGDGEVDENFWAQAAGRGADVEDESKSDFSRIRLGMLRSRPIMKQEVLFRSTPSSSMTIMMTDLVSMITMVTASVQRMQMLVNRTYWPRHRGRLVAFVPNS